MPEIYDLYKSFRNFIRNFELQDSLEVCWHLSNYLNFDKALPIDIELDSKLRNNFNPMLFRVNVIHEWELEFLVSEIILSAPERVLDHKKSLQSLKDRNRAVNLIRAIRDSLEKDIVDDEKIFIELNRKFHQQFAWQIFSQADYLYRYYSVFSFGKLDSMVKEKFDLTTRELFNVGLALTSLFYSSFESTLPLGSNITTVTSLMINKFLRIFALNIEDLINVIAKSRKYDDTLLYQFNPIKKYPLVIQNQLYCPIPINLYKQFSSGIYYAINNIQNFDNEFGISFQNYLANVIKKVNNTNKLVLIPEEKYGTEEKSTPDIILSDSDSILFIECKTKRMVWNAKENLLNTKDLDNDLKIIASAVYQVYKSLDDYYQNRYPSINYDVSKEVFIMVVTLEDWYVGYNNFLYNKIRDNIIDYFITDNRNARILLAIPYVIFSSDEFELAIQIMNSVGIKKYLHGFIHEGGRDAFKDFKRQSLFSEDIKSIFSQEK